MENKNIKEDRAKVELKTLKDFSVKYHQLDRGKMDVQTSTDRELESRPLTKQRGSYDSLKQNRCNQKQTRTLLAFILLATVFLAV